MVLEDLPDAERSRFGFDRNQLALLVKSIGQYGEHAAAKNAGFEKGDVIVSIDGANKWATESATIGRLLQRHQRGARVKAEVLRAGRQVDLILPMQ